MRDQLELVLYFVATQAAEGKVNHVFIDFGLQAVRDLRRAVKGSRREYDRLQTHADIYAEAMQFLDRAERGLTKIKRVDTSPGGASP